MWPVESDKLSFSIQKIMYAFLMWHVICVKTREEETRSETKKRCSHNLQSGHPVWWSANDCSIFPTLNIFRLFRRKRRTGRGNQKPVLKKLKKNFMHLCFPCISYSSFGTAIISVRETKTQQC